MHAPPFFTRYGFTRTADRTAPLVVDPYDAVCRRGALHAAVVASAVDLVGGFVTREAAGTDATFTTDLSVRIVRPGAKGPFRATAEPLRVGSRLVTTRVRLDAEEGVVALGETTFMRLPRRGEPVDVAALATPDTIASNPLEQPLVDEVGIEVVDAVAGQVRLPLRPALLNPEGVLQGALVALVVECGALALAESTRARPQIVTQLDLRYLSAASVGPVTGRAEWVGPADRGVMHVVLTDDGRGGRRTASAFVNVDDAPQG